jgi:23S rRNA (adenine-N6)-dimethyltransferase
VSAPHGAPWGCHRLDDRWARRLVERAGVGPGDLVVDVGAGTGALTAPLVGAGARVVAVELHVGRAAALRRRFGDEPVVVVPVDGRDLRLPRQPFRVVANPPFAITTALLRRLLAPGSRLLRADVVVPRHVAGRWLGRGAPGAGRWAWTFSMRRAGVVPRRAFHPAPPRDAVVLVIVRRVRPAATWQR